LIALRIGGGVPGGHDPQSVVDPDRIELALGEPHPVLLGDVFEIDFGQVVDAGSNRGGGDAADQVGRRIEQRHDAALVPQGHDGLAVGAARFAELRRFFVGSRLRVLDADGNRAGGEQGLGQRVRVCGVGLKGDADPHYLPLVASLLAASFSSR
jgi:hypothetical protein